MLYALFLDYFLFIRNNRLQTLVTNLFVQVGTSQPQTINSALDRNSVNKPLLISTHQQSIISFMQKEIMVSVSTLTAYQEETADYFGTSTNNTTKNTLILTHQRTTQHWSIIKLLLNLEHQGNGDQKGCIDSIYSIVLISSHVTRDKYNRDCDYLIKRNSIFGVKVVLR